MSTYARVKSQVQIHPRGLAGVEVHADAHGILGDGVVGLVLGVVPRAPALGHPDRSEVDVHPAHVHGHAGAADGGQDPPPVGIAAVQRGLDQGGFRNGARDAVSVLRRRRSLHAHLREARGAFPVADDLLREVARGPG
jgi:hypothetical protein